jgi:hypothetical protein
MGAGPDQLVWAQDRANPAIKVELKVVRRVRYMLERKSKAFFIA